MLCLNVKSLVVRILNVQDTFANFAKHFLTIYLAIWTLPGAQGVKILCQ